MAPIPNPPEGSERPEHATRHEHHEAQPAKAAAEAPKPTPHEPSSADHARAAHLRVQGLEELDRGSINHAVALLQAAAQLDPGNVLIKRDLERALRISQAVHARR